MSPVLSTDQIEQARAGLPYLRDVIYVDNAAVSPVPQAVQSAADRYNEHTVRRLREVSHLSEPVFDRGRVLAAKLVGVTADQIAYVQNTSHGLSQIALGLDWRAGDNLVVPAQEFPSNHLCWLQLEAHGVEVRKVEAQAGRIHPADIGRHVDRRTRLVAISHVQFYSGFRVDIPGIGELCRKAGALLVVDGTQSIGALTLDVSASGVDVLVVSGHKWMMAPRGIGFMALSERALARITPRIVGWLSVKEPYAFRRTLDLLPDARRFESGTPNGSGIFGLAERLRQIDELNPQAIEQRVIDLNRHLTERCAGAGLEILFRFDDRARSGIFLVRKPSVPAATVLAALAAAGICASVRSEAIRLSPHYYNTIDELDHTVATIASSVTA
jgi:cysteine desulfurase/selenocysteine lyase